MVLFALVAVMIVVGGLTRLTDSGLAITEWKPVTGAIPPMSAEAWGSEFTKYQEIPEYQLQNKGMTLSEFKSIYWWEWGHRQLGRTIGLVWAVGFLSFVALRKVPTGWTGRLFGIGALIGVQGAIGWWMVSSGLGDGMLDVASYRLATHLGLAFIILGFLIVSALRLGRSQADLMQARRNANKGMVTLSTILVGLAFAQVILGALVAGIDAGRGYPDWPLMAGGFLPPNPLDIEPMWRNFFENDGLVQFMHRMAGYLLFAFAIVVWLRGRKSAHPNTRKAFNLMMIAMLGQIALGIVTVINAAPVHIAIFHQVLAVVLWVLILRARFLSAYPIPTSVRGKS